MQTRIVTNARLIQYSLELGLKDGHLWRVHEGKLANHRNEYYRRTGSEHGNPPNVPVVASLLTHRCVQIQIVDPGLFYVL